MEKKQNYRIIQPLKKEVKDDVLFKSQLQEELLYRKQLLNEIKQRIRISIETNDQAFWKTLRILISQPEKE